MAHTFTKNHLHAVFSTKRRMRLITPDMKERLWQYMTGIAENIDLVTVAVGGMDDHLHMLFHLPPTLALCDALRLLKTNSSSWMSEHKHGFSWQEGYGAFAVSASNVPKVVKYIHDQEIHHRKMSFEDEYLGLLKKHGIDFDPRFVFD
jgi:REP element-mobilizing transposase RayT